LPVPAWTAGAGKATAASRVTALPVPAATEPAVASAGGADGLERQAAVTASSGIGAPPARQGVDRGLAHPPSAGMLALRVWLAGVLAMGATLLVGLVHVRVLAGRARALRDPALVERASRIAAELGVNGPVRLLQGGPDAMPMTFGLLGASLLMPSSARTWSPARQEAVLRHELAHIRRRDSLTQLVADIGCALYWFHPLMWLAARQLRVEREHACDDVVLVSGARATDYATELLQIARTMRTQRMTARVGLAMAQPTRLRTRIAAVLEDRRRAERLSDRLLVPFWSGAVALIMTVAAVAPAPVRAAIDGEVALAVPTVGYARLDMDGPYGTSVAPAPAPGLDAREPLPAPVQVVSASPEPDCWENSHGYHYIRTVDGGGERSQQYLIQQSLGDTQLCVRAVGSLPFDEQGAQLERMSVGDRLVLASRTSAGRQTLEIVRTSTGFDHTWFVDGTRTPFDDTARQWRDAMLEVAGGYEGIGRIRGEVGTLRGEIGRVRGEEGRLRGEIGRIRGEEGRLRGEIGRIRGEEARLRGDIGRIRGDEARLRGEIGLLRGRISSLEGARRTTQDVQTQNRLAAEIAETQAEIQRAERRLSEHETASRLGEVERRIAEYDAAGKIREVEDQIRTDTADRVREIERRIAEYDAASRIREIEARIEAIDADRRISRIQQRLEPQERRLQELQRRIR
jgi:beta-lactamase regulating signal transducer with metallopeptidase domain